MADRGFSDDELTRVETYLKILRDRFVSVHCDPNVQIFFDNVWGYVDDGEFVECGTFDQLVEHLQTHCDECKKAWADV